MCSCWVVFWLEDILFNFLVHDRGSGSFRLLLLGWCFCGRLLVLCVLCCCMFHVGVLQDFFLFLGDWVGVVIVLLSYILVGFCVVVFIQLY